MFPAYDLLPVKLLLPEDKDDFALTMHGKNRNLHRKDFLLFADECGIGRQIAERLMQMVVAKKETYFSMNAASLLPPDMQAAFADLIENRCAILMQ